MFDCTSTQDTRLLYDYRELKIYTSTKGFRNVQKSEETRVTQLWPNIFLYICIHKSLVVCS